MGRFDLVSPGAVAGDAVSRYFDELVAKRREKLNDQLGVDREQRLKEQHAATLELQREQLKSVDEQRKATVAARQAETELAQQKAFAGQHRPGDEVSAEQAGRFPGLVHSTPATQGAMIGTDEQDIPTYEVNAAQSTFRGTPEQRQAEETKVAVRNVLTNTPELGEHPGIKAALQLAEATGDYSGIYGALATMTKEPTATNRSLQQQANDAHAKGDMKEYNRLLGVIKQTGQADDRPLTPYIWMNPGAAPAIIDRTTGKVRDVSMPDGSDVPVQNTAEGANRASSLGRVHPVLDSVAELSERINVNQGVYATAAGAAARAAAKVNLDDDVAEYEAMVQAFTPLWARALGHVGVLTEQDVQSARKALPAPEDSKSLRDRKLARIQKIMGGQVAADANSASPRTPQGETPEQRRTRLYDKYSKSK